MGLKNITQESPHSTFQKCVEQKHCQHRAGMEQLLAAVCGLCTLSGYHPGIPLHPPSRTEGPDQSAFAPCCPTVLCTQGLLNSPASMLRSPSGCKTEMVLDFLAHKNHERFCIQTGNCNIRM